ncbi:hypothetical protein [Selenomonas ruminantium]|uniref:hypothetical protein n=1 Tax=Selenomonas ruminantium TaxID=971 RepID=UPI0026F094D0|nr:hypothetical protein [Selenomonas ruminantium]
MKKSAIQVTVSAGADDVFPQLLTSLSMAKEKYHQHPRTIAYRCNVRNKLLGQMMFSRRVWQACLSKGKILSAPSAFFAPLCNVQTKPGGAGDVFRSF